MISTRKASARYATAQARGARSRFAVTIGHIAGGDSSIILTPAAESWSPPGSRRGRRRQHRQRGGHWCAVVPRSSGS